MSDHEAKAAQEWRRAWQDRSTRNLTAPMMWLGTVLEVHDGDTIKVDLDLHQHVSVTDRDLGFHLRVEGKHLHLHTLVRLFGLNAAELSTPEGKAAQAALAAKIPPGSAVILTTWLDRNDKYGRVLAEVHLAGADINHAGEDINQWLVANGWAAPWDGTGTKPVPTPTVKGAPA